MSTSSTASPIGAKSKPVDPTGPTSQVERQAFEKLAALGEQKLMEGLPSGGFVSVSLSPLPDNKLTITLRNEGTKDQIAFNIDISNRSTSVPLMGNVLERLFDKAILPGEAERAINELAIMEGVTWSSSDPVTVNKGLQAVLQGIIGGGASKYTYKTNAAYHGTDGPVAGFKNAMDAAFGRSHAEVKKDAPKGAFSTMRITADHEGYLVECTTANQGKNGPGRFAVRIPVNAGHDALQASFTKISKLFHQEQYVGTEIAAKSELVKELLSIGQLSRLENVNLTGVTILKEAVAKDFVMRNVVLRNCTVELSSQPGQTRFELDRVTASGKSTLMIHAPASTNGFAPLLKNCSFQSGTVMVGSLARGHFDHCTMRGVNAFHCDLSEVEIIGMLRGWNYHGMILDTTKAPPALKNLIKEMKDPLKATTRIDKAFSADNISKMMAGIGCQVTEDSARAKKEGYKTIIQVTAPPPDSARQVILKFRNDSLVDVEDMAGTATTTPTASRVGKSRDAAAMYLFNAFRVGGIRCSDPTGTAGAVNSGTATP